MVGFTGNQSPFLGAVQKLPIHTTRAKSVLSSLWKFQGFLPKMGQRTNMFPIINHSITDENPETNVRPSPHLHVYCNL